MSNPSVIHSNPPPLRWQAALMSFAVPGLGQIVQGIYGKSKGRLIKGIVFLVIIWGMFGYGFAKAEFKNVYLAHAQEQFLEEDKFAGGKRNRAFGIGGMTFSPLMGDLVNRCQYPAQFWVGIPAWPALWNYFFADTPILENYYQSPGAMKKGEVKSRQTLLEEREAADNTLQLKPTMGRLWDIYWIYTVIAGVLGLLVIYDAWAGPVKMVPKPVKKGAK